MSLSSELIKLVDSITEEDQLDESLELNEAAAMIADVEDGFKVTAEVYSEDHPPAHMHIFNKDKSKEIGRVIIRNRKPRTLTDIVPYSKKEPLTQQQRADILEMMRSFNKKEGVTYYRHARNTWDRLHPKFKVGENGYQIQKNKFH